ncbi:MAG: efflux transporter outer membrane subunit, partial [Burkholderiales bacterium]
MTPRLSVAALLVIAAGCASQDGLQKHSAPNDSLQLKVAQSLAAAPVDPNAWPSEQWWKALGDPQLDALIEEALAGSPGIRLARARVNRAVALAEAAGAPRYPQVGLDFEATRERLSEHGVFPPPLAGKTIWQNIAQLNFS